VLAAQHLRAQRRRLLAGILDDAANLRRGQQRRVGAGEVAEAAVDGLAREPEIARDRGERGAVGERLRDLAALERVKLATQLAELAQRGAGGSGVRRLLREQDESSRSAFDVDVNV
jgi:hypothetical protein